MTTVFDGNAFAKQRLEKLRQRVAGLAYVPKLVSVVFQEDAMGMLYTNLKAEAAKSVGIEFEKLIVKFDDSNHRTLELIRQKCLDSQVIGMLIQKPNKNQFREWILNHFDKLSASRAQDDADEIVGGRRDDISYPEWWGEITDAIDPAKDVDCLTKENLDKIYRGESEFLPATARAVVSILKQASKQMDNSANLNDWLCRKQIVVVGRSELVGKPLGAYLQNIGVRCQVLGSRDNIRQNSIQADIIISATGKANLITGEMVKEGAVVIDVGEPKGDVDFESVNQIASFITPVPGGVGPVTVVSLLENLLELAVV